MRLLLTCLCRRSAARIGWKENWSWGIKNSRVNSLLSSRMSLPHDCCPMLYFDYISLRNPRAYSINRESKGDSLLFLLFIHSPEHKQYLILSLVNFVNSVPYRLRWLTFVWRCYLYFAFCLPAINGWPKQGGSAVLPDVGGNCGFNPPPVPDDSSILAAASHEAAEGRAPRDFISELKDDTTLCQSYKNAWRKLFKWWHNFC